MSSPALSHTQTGATPKRRRRRWPLWCAAVLCILSWAVYVGTWLVGVGTTKYSTAFQTPGVHITFPDMYHGQWRVGGGSLAVDVPDQPVRTPTPIDLSYRHWDFCNGRTWWCTTILYPSDRDAFSPTAAKFIDSLGHFWNHLDSATPRLIRAYPARPRFYWRDLWPWYMDRTARFALTVPLWPAAAALSLPFALLWRRKRRLDRRADTGRCGHCGYDRSSLAAETVCPECGRGGKPA